MAFSADVWRLVADSSLMSRGVLLVLLLLSVLTWAVVGRKLVEFALAQRQSAQLKALFDSGATPAQVYRSSKGMHASPMCALFRAGYEQVRGKKVEPQTLWLLLQGIGAEEIGRLERYLPLLATAASVSPFVGLLGTVWGIMAAFNNIGVRGSASLAVVAPGIAEALVATAAGLAVAIPAVVAYNAFASKVDAVQRELDRFAAQLALLLESPPE